LVKLLHNHLDDNALVGRLGGDEFAVLIVDIDEQRAREITEHINQTCNAASAIVNEEDTVTLRFSLGAVFCDDLGVSISIDNLVNSADEVMYQRKHHGKGGYKFACYNSLAA